MKIAGRYEIKDSLGRGGMGIVYRAFDTVTKRHVALKTMLDLSDPIALQLFQKEWTVLAGLSHPNIVDILDTGEIIENGEPKPYFVMPLLPGSTLADLMQNSSQRLTVERVTEIMSQTCRGLQAAHDRGLIHRDLKPSNIFVMEDDTAKIIDFGVVHLTGTKTSTGMKGTLQYMAPEQIELKPSTPASDIFSLGVVCYEALTGRKPFARTTAADTADALRNHVPPPASDINPLVSPLLARVVHKAMAKQPLHRYSSARDFSETLQKAVHNQPIERFDRERIQPRIERARKAFDEGDHQFASEILVELEAEGHIDSEITMMRLQIGQAARSKKIRQLLESARTRIEQEEFPLALQKLLEVLEIDPNNADALRLKGDIERQHSEKQIAQWLGLVKQHLERQDFTEARRGLQEVLRANPGESRAINLLNDVDRREKDAAQVSGEKEKLFGLARDAFQNGEISTALTKLERILDLQRRSPDSSHPERDSLYQGLYNQVRSERDSIRNGYEEGRRQLAEKNFTRALEVCDEVLNKYPGDALFQALRIEVVERQRQELSSYIAEIGRRVDAEPDLDRRVNLLKDATERFPQEQQFQHSLKLMRERRDLVNSIVAKSRQYAERGQFAEAIGQWEILRSIHGQYPGIDFEVEQLGRRREHQSHEEAKARYVEQIDRALAVGDFERAQEVSREALQEFEGDKELAGLERMARQGIERSTEAREMLAEGQRLCSERRFDEAIGVLRQAAELNERNPTIRTALVNVLTEQARAAIDISPDAAEPLIAEALALDPGNTIAMSLRTVQAERQHKDFINERVAQVRELQLAGDLNGALRSLEDSLATYPGDPRLTQLQSTLNQANTEFSRARTSHGDRTAHGEHTMTSAMAPPPVSPSSASNSSSAAPPPEATEWMDLAALPPANGANIAPPPPAAPVSAPPPNAGPANSAPVAAPPPPPVPPVLPPPGAPRPPESAQRPEKPKVKAQKPPKPPKPPKAVPAAAQAAQRNAQAPGKKGPILLIGGIAAVLLAIAGAGVFALLHRHPAPTQSTAAGPPLQAQVQLVPPDAKFYLNGAEHPANFEAASGQTYHLKAEKLGYKTYESDYTAKAGSNPPPIVLDPEPLNLRVVTGGKSGSVVLDGKPIGDLQDGQLPNFQLPANGDHTLQITDGKTELLSFAFKAGTAIPPTLSEPLKTPDLLVVSSLGSDATLYSGSPIKANQKDQPPQDVGADGLKLTNVTSANNELSLKSGKDERAVAIDISNAPLLAVYLNANPNQSSVSITSNAKSGRVFIDGKESRQLRNGAWSKQLAPGSYKIKIVSDGFEDLEQQVDVAKGTPVSVPFNLKGKAALGILTVQGGTPEASVLLDGTKIGAVDGSGNFRYDRVPLGPHAVELSKENAESTKLTKSFLAGQAVALSGAEAQVKAFGLLIFQVFPTDTSVQYKRDDESESHSAKVNETVRLKEGKYTVSLQADGYQPVQKTYEVGAGRISTVDVKLTQVRAGAKAAPVVAVVSGSVPSFFEQPGRVEKDGDWWHNKGQGYSLLKSGHSNFVLIVLKTKAAFGRIRKPEWVIDYHDEHDKIVYDMDEHTLYRKPNIEGDKKEVKIKHESPGTSFWVRVSVTPEKIVIQDEKDAVLDQYSVPGRNLSSGKIGISGDLHFVIR